MKLTNKQLKQLIKEELNNVLAEAEEFDYPIPPHLYDPKAKARPPIEKYPAETEEEFRRFQLAGNPSYFEAMALLKATGGNLRKAVKSLRGAKFPGYRS